MADESKNFPVPELDSIFTPNGLSMKDMAVKLHERGYMTDEEMASESGVPALRRKILDELSGKRLHHSKFQNSRVDSTLPKGFEMQRNPLKSFSFTINSEKHQLDEEQLVKLNKWLAELAERIDEKHRTAGHESMVETFKQKGKVYAGVIGGNLTYSITPTSVGTAFKVADSITGESIDLTDYDKW